MKIGFFHAGITDVAGFRDDDDDAGVDHRDFFMLRPFDLKGTTEKTASGVLYVMTLSSP